jgi:hypothetical protein
MEISNISNLQLLLKNAQNKINYLNLSEKVNHSNRKKQVSPQVLCIFQPARFARFLPAFGWIDMTHTPKVRFHQPHTAGRRSKKPIRQCANAPTRQILSKQNSHSSADYNPKTKDQRLKTKDLMTHPFTKQNIRKSSNYYLNIK